MSETIQELFDKDPLSLTRDNLDQVIEHFRKARAQWVLGSKEPKREGKIDLAQLDLELPE